MIGSLGEFITLQNDQILEKYLEEETKTKQIEKKSIKKRGASMFEPYIAQDKTDLLLRYQKNNIYKINRKIYDVISKQVKTTDKIKKPLYEHRSFFVKPEIAHQDYIAKEELKRKHNLLRAMLRMKQTEQQPKGDSDYQQSFQRLYSGFKSIHPNPIIHQPHQEQVEQAEMPIQKSIVAVRPKSKSHLPNHRRLEFEHCLSWAKKHKKNGDYFEQQLGKGDFQERVKTPNLNRSLIDDIGKKIDSSWVK